MTARKIGDRRGPLTLDSALIRWRVLKQAGRPPLKISDLRSVPVSFATLPKLDVVGSSPIARSLSCRRVNLLRKSATDLGGRFFVL